jgi:hypothetical protein
MQVKEEFFLHLHRKMEPIEGSETSAFKPQTPGKYPKENILYTLLLFRSGSLAHSVNVIPKLQEGLSRNRTQIQGKDFPPLPSAAESTAHVATGDSDKKLTNLFHLLSMSKRGAVLLLHFTLKWHGI